MTNLKKFLVTLLIISIPIVIAENNQGSTETPGERNDTNRTCSKPELQFLQPIAQGGIVGVARNAYNHAMTFENRKSNLFTIHDKTQLSSTGNPRWFTRFDKPHPNVPTHHINVNPKISGVKDPHIPISEITAKGATVVGKGLNVLNKVSNGLMYASVVKDLWDIGSTYKEDDRKDYKTEKVVATKFASYAAGFYGANAGAAIGTTIFPGIGTMVGGIIGGMLGGIGGESAGRVITGTV